MKQYEVLFAVNETEKIIIDFNEPLEQVMYADRIPIAFYLQNKKYLIGQSVIGSDLSEFVEILTKVLHNQLPLHSSVTDFGYLYAQCRFYSCYEDILKPQNTIVFDDNNLWVGYNNLMFAYEYALWIYNDAQGDIIIECAPSYSGPTYDPDELHHESSLKSFLATYKPFYKNKVSHQVVQAWLLKAQALEQQILDNLKTPPINELPENDGQRALDKSVRVENSTCRVAVIDDQIILFEETFVREFHGIIITWQYVVNNNDTERWQAIQEALIKNKLVKCNGEICK